MSSNPFMKRAAAQGFRDGVASLSASAVGERVRNVPPAPFLINPYGKKSIWMPEPYQMLRYPNPSLLNSLWLGLVAPIVLLPYRIWHEFIKWLLVGELQIAALSGRRLVSSSLRWAAWGVAGNAYAVQAHPSQLMLGHVLPPKDSALLSAEGGAGHVIELEIDDCGRAAWERVRTLWKDKT